MNPRFMITGASSGIGRAAALLAAKQGFDLVLVARREDKLRELAGEIKNTTGRDAAVRAGDLLDESFLLRLMESIENDERLDVLINNAGAGMNGAFADADAARIDDVVRLDFEVPMRTCRAAARGMVRRGRGTIVNVASIAAFIPTPYHAVYSAAKSGFLNFGEALDLEVAGRGVRVRTVCPGVTDTEFFETGRYVTTSKVYAMKRATPEGVAEAVLAAALGGRRTRVTGARNRLLTGLALLLPRRFVIRMAGRVMNPAADRR